MAYNTVYDSSLWVDISDSFVTDVDVVFVLLFESFASTFDWQGQQCYDTWFYNTL